MSVVSCRRAEVVECLALNPCWSRAGERCSLSEGKTSASRTLAAGHSSEMGLYDVPWEESLPGFGIGMINEVFQIAGSRHDWTESL